MQSEGRDQSGAGQAGEAGEQRMAVDDEDSENDADFNPNAKRRSTVFHLWPSTVQCMLDCTHIYAYVWSPCSLPSTVNALLLTCAVGPRAVAVAAARAVARVAAAPMAVALRWAVNACTIVPVWSVSSVWVPWDRCYLSCRSKCLSFVTGA